MLYYGEYSNGRRYVRVYNEEKHGAPRIVGKLAFLHHGAVSTVRKLSRRNTSARVQ